MPAHPHPDRRRPSARSTPRADGDDVPPAVGRVVVRRDRARRGHLRVTPPQASPFDHWPAPSAALRIAVVVPVRDEGPRLRRTLEALAAQRHPDGSAFDPRRYEVLVLANNCGDDTAAVAERFARERPGFRLHTASVVFPAAVAHVGHARRVIMDAACERLGRAGGAADGVIASTDGDTRVAPTWLADNLAEIDAGADAVGGRILIGNDGDAEADRAGARDAIAPGLRRWVRLDATWRLMRSRLVSLIDPDPADPWPRHHQHFGASLAIRRSAYLAVGGLPDVRFLEDRELMLALRRTDLKLRHSPRVRVLTSGRSDGRVEQGLSVQLGHWDRHRHEAPSLEVDAASELLADARARRQLRNLWDAPPRDATAFEALAAPWRLPADWLAERTADAATFGALWAEVEQRRWQPPVARVPVQQAIEELRRLIALHAAGPAAREKTSRR